MEWRGACPLLMPVSQQKGQLLTSLRSTCQILVAFFLLPAEKQKTTKKLLPQSGASVYFPAAYRSLY